MTAWRRSEGGALINPVKWLDSFVTRRLFQPVLDRYLVEPIAAASLALEVSLASSLALFIQTRPWNVGTGYLIIALYSAGWLLAQRHLTNWKPVSRLLIAFAGCLGILLGSIATPIIPGLGLTLLVLSVSGASAPYLAACVVPAAQPPRTS